MLKKIIYFIANWISFFISSLIPVKKDLVIFTGTSISTYNENSRYLYEYLVKNQELSPVWMTNSTIVYNYLDNKKYPVVWHKSFLGLWHYMRAGVVIATGMSYPSLLKFVGNKTVKIWIGHGVGVKGTNSADSGPFKSSLQLVKKMHMFDYVNFTSKHVSLYQGKLQYLLPKHKIIVLGYPRCDNLLDKRHTDKAHTKKSILKRFNYEIHGNEKFILYSPTWRPKQNSFTFPLSKIDNFNFLEFDSWLNENDIYFLISVHPSEFGNLKDFSNCNNIRYLPQDHLIDITQLLPEIDLLITDYSSISADYMLMNRPVIYVMPDYDYYFNENGLLEDIRLSLPGIEVKNMFELKSSIIRSLKNPGEMQSSRNIYLEKYYDTSNLSSCDKFLTFIENLTI